MKAHSSPFLNAFYQVSTFSIFNGLSPGLLLSIRPSYHDPQVHRSRCQRPYFRHFHHLPHLRLRSHGNDGNRLSCPPSGNLSDSSRLLRGTKHRTAEGTVAPRRPAATPGTLHASRFTSPPFSGVPQHRHQPATQLSRCSDPSIWSLKKKIIQTRESVRPT